jgi:hypothetical protein
MIGFTTFRKKNRKKFKSREVEYVHIHKLNIQILIYEGLCVPQTKNVSYINLVSN